MEALITQTRKAIHNIIAGKDDRLLVVIGPCSITTRQRRLDYAAACGWRASSTKDTLEIVMRVYFRKPRTTVGWKGLINDPTWMRATASTRACALRANCSSRSTGWACRRAASFWT